MLQDIRYALRVLSQNRSFAAVAILSLALGIGANTAIFTLIDYVVLRPLPVRAPASTIRTTAMSAITPSPTRAFWRRAKALPPRSPYPARLGMQRWCRWRAYPATTSTSSELPRC